jgi:hypothetical protein
MRNQGKVMESIIPVEPPIVNINKKRSPKNADVVLSCKNGGFPRYVLNQLKIFVPVGKDIKIVTLITAEEFLGIICPTITLETYRSRSLLFLLVTKMLKITTMQH